jgi:hypothetical protein
LNSLGIAHGAGVDAPYGSGLSCPDPDNIALESFAPRRWSSTPASRICPSVRRRGASPIAGIPLFGHTARLHNNGQRRQEGV